MESKFSRRFFIGGLASAGALAGCGSFRRAGAAAEGGHLMRMGVLSDIHLRSAGDEATLRKAFEFFRARKVDAVLIAGDTADGGQIAQMKLAADTWFEVFPDDKLPGGHKVQRLFIYGNHCLWGNSEKHIGPRRAQVWKELFHEDYEPIWKKTVNGIPVIGAHWIPEKEGNQIEAYMAAHGRELDPALPFVYTQHDHPKDTCLGPWAWGHDDGRATRALSPFPNAVAFSGHSHYTLVDERTVWQGAFTSVNTASLRYASIDYALRENIGGNGYGYKGEKRSHRMAQKPTDDGRQGQVVSFWADRMVIERRDFVYGESLGDDWVVPLPASESKPFSYAARAAKRSAPVFAEGAEVAVTLAEPKDEKDFHHVELTFPAASEVDRCRVCEYEVTAVLVEDDVELVQAQRRMMTPDYYLPRTKLVDKVGFTFAAEDLPMKGHYRFEVRALECFGKKGDKIVSPIVEVA